MPRTLVRSALGTRAPRAQPGVHRRRRQRLAHRNTTTTVEARREPARTLRSPCPACPTEPPRSAFGPWPMDNERRRTNPAAPLLPARVTTAREHPHALVPAPPM